FEESERVTIDGYSYLQDTPPAKPVSAPIVRRSSRPSRSSRASRSSSDRVSPMPLIFGILVLVVGFSAMKLIMNLKRLAPQGTQTAQVSPSASPIPTSTTTPALAAATASASPSIRPAATPPASAEPEVRRAKPLGPE